MPTPALQRRDRFIDEVTLLKQRASEPPQPSRTSLFIATLKTHFPSNMPMRPCSALRVQEWTGRERLEF
jgi:hypothetical protein